MKNTHALLHGAAKDIAVSDSLTRQHWVQRITFAAKTNATDTHTQTA